MKILFFFFAALVVLVVISMIGAAVGMYAAHLLDMALHYVGVW